MKIGYARVSTKDQNLNSQLDALNEFGCEMIFQEKISGKSKEKRLELKRMMDQVRKGDVVVVYRLDRLGRSLKDLIFIIEEINSKGASFVSLHDQIDTTTPQGQLTFHIFASLVEFQRTLISERTKDGLKAARARGKNGGRPKGLSQKTQQKARVAASLYQNNEMSISEICGHLEISKSTLYRYLKHESVPIGVNGQ